MNKADSKVSLGIIVRQLTRYFYAVEAENYSDAINPLTDITYRVEAWHKFVRYYLEGNRYATEDFYKDY